MSPFRLALLCLCLAPLASSAALSGQVHFSGRVINPACVIAPRHDRSHAEELVKRRIAVWPKDAERALKPKPGDSDFDTDIG